MVSVERASDALLGTTSAIWQMDVFVSSVCGVCEESPLGQRNSTLDDTAFAADGCFPLTMAGNVCAGLKSHILCLFPIM